MITIILILHFLHTLKTFYQKQIHPEWKLVRSPCLYKKCTTRLNQKLNSFCTIYALIFSIKRCEYQKLTNIKKITNKNTLPQIITHLFRTLNKNGPFSFRCRCVHASGKDSYLDKLNNYFTQHYRINDN